MTTAPAFGVSLRASGATTTTSAASTTAKICVFLPIARMAPA
jgi:hypothetical protein